MKRLVVVFVVAVSACSSDDSLTAPLGPPRVTTYTLTGTVTESEPTRHVALPGTVIRVLNGSAAGLST